MKNIFLIGCFCFWNSLNAQVFESGVILDSLPIANNSDETFALYLPKPYSPKKLSPVLFIFSPSGNGRRGIEVFKKAAEAFNYILVCSNNARNGPHNRNFAIAERLLNHVFANFSIDENRIYLAGFSGGSRLATSIAVLTGLFKGVIACGAGFPSVPEYIPSNQDFYYVGICGDRDMNFQEMLDTSTYLNRLKFRNTLFTFDGNHIWPPNEQLFIAFETLETEAYKKGTLKLTPDRLKSGYIKNYILIKAAISQEKPLLAAERYQHTLNTYGIYYNLDSLKNGLAKLKKSRSYVNVSKQRNIAFESEDLFSEKLISRFMNEFDNPERVNLKWWDKELERLDKLAKKSNPETNKMAERVQYKLFAAAYEINHFESDMGSMQKEFRNAILSKIQNRLFRKGSNKKND